MSRRAVLSLTILVVLAALVVGAAASAWHQLTRPLQMPGGSAEIVVIEPGQPAGHILELLEARGILPSAVLARVYFQAFLDSPALKAGEYELRSGVSTIDILGILARGEVLMHPVTILEGLTLEETAELLAEAGFGLAARFHELMSDPAAIVDLDPLAEDLEGYVFPDTYHFARSTPEPTIVGELVKTFRRNYEAEVAPLLDDEDPRSLREIVTLASIVEKETSLDHERPTVAGVYANRLRRGIGLYADPTIIYALKKMGRWDGNLRRTDLKLDSPYNTYVVAGLPPGPICSPGLKSLLSAARPEDVPYLYFVSRNDGSHVFARTLAEHNRNVDKWQKQYWQERWAAERRRESGTD